MYEAARQSISNALASPRLLGLKVLRPSCTHGSHVSCELHQGMVDGVVEISPDTVSMVDGVVEISLNTVSVVDGVVEIVSETAWLTVLSRFPLTQHG